MPKQPQVVVYKPYAPTTHSAKRARTDVAHERDAFMVSGAQAHRRGLYSTCDFVLTAYL